MKRIVLFVVSAAITSMAASPVLAGKRYDPAFYDYAEVIEAKPVIELVRVDSPRQECWTETRIRYGYRSGQDSYTPEIFGAIVGAVIGNRFGSGRGRDLATAAGAVLGGSIGHDAKRRRHRHVYNEPVERCETRHEFHEQEHVVGYQVKYRYGDRIYHSRTGQDPGDRIRVRVQVEPAEQEDS
jgi:uncharacterized protein YcfJ